MAPLYPFIKEEILKNIREGVYQIDKMLPPEREFTEKYNVSRMTIRRALDELIQDGVLIRKPGSGVFIAKKKKTRSLNKVSIKRDQEIIDCYGKITNKIIAFKTVVNHPIPMRYLNLNADEEVYQIKRVQYGGKTPIVYENIFLPKRCFKTITLEDCTRSMHYIVRDFFIGEIDLKREIEIEARLASKMVATYLGLTKNAPILQITNIENDKNYNPLYCGVNSFDATEFKYYSK